MKSYTLSYSESQQCFICRYRTKDGGWSTKNISRKIGRNEIEAEREAIRFLSSYYSGEVVTQLPPKTIALLAPRWLEYKKNDIQNVKLNTYKGFYQSINNWVLENPKFPHLKIDHLDMEEELTGEVLVAWIGTLKGKYSSRLSHILALSAMYGDCLGLGWLDKHTINPFTSKPVTDAIANVRKNMEKVRAIEGIIQLEFEEVIKLLQSPNKKIRDYRRVKYVVALATGLRDSELHGLIWDDLVLNHHTPFVKVERQLMKYGPQPFINYELAVMENPQFNLEECYQAVMSLPKRNKKRVLPLHKLAVAVLKWWKETGWQQYVGRAPDGNDPVFARGKESLKPGQVPDGFCMSESADLLKADLERAGVDRPDMTMHGLRRTFATLMGDVGVEEHQVGKFLGHGAKSTVTKHYLEVKLKMMASLLSNLDLGEYVQLQYTRVTA